jgi:hypothetical protein
LRTPSKPLRFNSPNTNKRSRDGSVGIATGYGLNGRGLGVRVLVGQHLSILPVVQTGSGARPAS